MSVFCCVVLGVIGCGLVKVGMFVGVYDVDGVLMCSVVLVSGN